MPLISLEEFPAVLIHFQETRSRENNLILKDEVADSGLQQTEALRPSPITISAERLEVVQSIRYLGVNINDLDVK